MILKKTTRFQLLLLLAIFPMFSRAQYQAKWSSLDQRPIPTWWTDAKFGIFIHWGLYSVPAYAPIKEVEGVYEKYAEHYANRLIHKNPLFMQHHQKYWGAHFTYADFAPLFKAEYFKPEAWADLFKRSGAKYVVLTSKHHDGFCLWPSAQSPHWNSVEMGPHRDLAGDLTTAVRKAGLHMGFYYSLLEWNHPLYQAATMNRWADEHMIPQMKDLVNRYRPEVIFADGEWDYPNAQLKSEEFLAWLYNESPVKNSVVVNDRWGKETRSKHGDYYTTEYDLVHNQVGIGDQADHPWEESRGMGTSYGYNQFENAEDYSSAKQLIDLLIDKVSHGGNLLLNIGPKANGLIPVVMQERLLAMGTWLAVNGEAIYGTTAGKAQSAKADAAVAFTQKDDALYIICKQWPNTPLRIITERKARQVQLLGSNQSVSYRTKGKELLITAPTLAPDKLPCDYAWVFKVVIGDR